MRLRLERRGRPEFPPLFIPSLSSRAIKYSKIPPMPSATPVTPRVTRISRPPPHSLAATHLADLATLSTPGNTLLHFSASRALFRAPATRESNLSKRCRLSVCLSVCRLHPPPPPPPLFMAFSIQGGGGYILPKEEEE